MCRRLLDQQGAHYYARGDHSLHYKERRNNFGITHWSWPHSGPFPWGRTDDLSGHGHCKSRTRGQPKMVQSADVVPNTLATSCVSLRSMAIISLKVTQGDDADDFHWTPVTDFLCMAALCHMWRSEAAGWCTFSPFCYGLAAQSQPWTNSLEFWLVLFLVLKRELQTGNVAHLCFLPAVWIAEKSWKPHKTLTIKTTAPTGWIYVNSWESILRLVGWCWFLMSLLF